MLKEYNSDGRQAVQASPQNTVKPPKEGGDDDEEWPSGEADFICFWLHLLSIADFLFSRYHLQLSHGAFWHPSRGYRRGPFGESLLISPCRRGRHQSR